ncbi:unnamed protein product [Cuscuta europaea]|uniref:Helitron helicase-like domain-containing protein n=1 Tax=Cuscuta europaea TaxID=41803 RepID=A0A9P1EF91_CUSEU|nr:unnamed protein product [Cuscuta europaea]
MIEAQRLSFIRANKKQIRADVLSGLQEAIDNGEKDATLAGKRIILPGSFTSGTRYMFNNCQDAMAICKRYEYPDLFITITCNLNLPEIHDVDSASGLVAFDRPDIVCRVFKLKLHHLMADLRKHKVFGKVNAGMYTIEFQKRGLPHAHILLWLDGENRLNNPIDIDKVISAELPHSELYPKLAEAVKTLMIHGPCGAANYKSPSMKEKRCDKFFPKKFTSSTSIDEDGYPTYRRRETGISINKNGVMLDNRNVVPNNPYLLMKYHVHVNVEYCNKSNSIKCVGNILWCSI